MNYNVLKMITQLEVNDEVVRKYAVESLVQRLQKQLELEHLKMLAEEINEAIQEAGLDNGALWEEARAEAWEQYKKRASQRNEFE